MLIFVREEGKFEIRSLDRPSLSSSRAYYHNRLLGVLERKVGFWARRFLAFEGKEEKLHRERRGRTQRAQSKHVIEKFPEDFPAINKNQIMQRASVGNDDAAHLFGDTTKTFQIGGELVALAKAKGLAVFEKAVCLKTVEFEEFSYLGVSNLALSVGLNDEGLQRLARKIFRLSPERLQKRIRNGDLDCGRHILHPIIAQRRPNCRFRSFEPGGSP